MWLGGWLSKADDTCRTKSLEGIGGRWGWTNGKKREEWVNRIEPQTKLMFCLLNYP
ncbi:hypothetical protein [Blautia marasmi]|uniref:hypothetical protein n=1 Tax=Blautia marasmi TaxID=1917868 RepID=UPI00266C2EB1|nr:hypothetical protein [Blautia marasmi]